MIKPRPASYSGVVMSKCSATRETTLHTYMYIHLHTYTCIIYRTKHIIPGRCYAAGNLLFKALTLQPHLRHLRRLRFGRLINRIRTILQLRETVLKVSRSVTRVSLEGSSRFMVHEWLIHFTRRRPCEVI